MAKNSGRPAPAHQAAKAAAAKPSPARPTARSGAGAGPGPGQQSTPQRDNVECPLCGGRVAQGLINLHIDTCLLKQERREERVQTEARTSKPKTDRTKPAIKQDVECPLGCGQHVSLNMINMHIDICLLHQEKAITQRASAHTSAASTSTASPATATAAAKTAAPDTALATLLKPLQSFERAANITRSPDVPGLFLLHDFITAEEEASIICSIDADTQTPWRHSSFNGHCDSKSFGVRTQFGLPGVAQERAVRKNNPALGEHDLPAYLLPYPQRLHDMVMNLDGVPIELKNFIPNECNCNSYETSQQHSLRPHFDDRALSGPLLMNLSLGCDARMTYISPKQIEIVVSLPRRCLQIVIGPARWVYQHCIKASDVLGDRRVSITWRHAGSKNSGIREMKNSSSNNFTYR